MATAYLTPQGLFTGFDNSGNVVSGGLLHTYVTGTTTPAPTYTTNDTTGSANANPVVMNSAGRATIFLDPGVTYKFVFATAADVTLWTADPVISGGEPVAGSITLAMMADLAQDQFIGRTTASTGVPETATITAAARTVLDDTTVAAMVNTLGGATATGSGALVRASAPAFTAQPTTVIKTGDVATVGGVVDSQHTAVGNIGAGADDLMSYTIPANTLTTAGQAVRVTGWGLFAANANVKDLRLLFDGSIIFDGNTSGNFNGYSWYVQSVIVLQSATAWTSGTSFNGALLPNSGAVFVQTGNPSGTASNTTTMSNPIVKFTGESASAATDDIQQFGMLIEIL